MNAYSGGMIWIGEVDAHDPRAVGLEQEYTADHVERYGEPDQDPSNSMYTAAHVVLMTVSDEPVGLCGWDVWENGDGKIRLFFVAPAHRRQGYAEMLLRWVEERMRHEGITYARFESGPNQEPAHKLYFNNGYESIEGFGFYKDNPGSVFFGKELG